MTFVQRLVLRFAGRRAAAIEAESRSWVVTCPDCGSQRSFWDLGGIRYKASSTGKKVGSVCDRCGTRGMFEVTRVPPAS